MWLTRRNFADDGLVACPICWTRMKPWQVDKHIDTSCPGTPEPQNAPTPASNSRDANPFGTSPSSFTKSPARSKAPERLPPLNYSMLKDTALRKKMAELGLSTSGSRQMLERRHREWITLWNANCDSARPKRKSELLHDLEVWERTVGSRAPIMSRATTLGAQIKDKDFDGAAWAAKHDSSFKDLIASARRTRRDVEQRVKDDSQSGENSKEPDSAQGDEKGLAQPPPGFPRAVDVDLTEPPSSQPGSPDSPSGSRHESTHLSSISEAVPTNPEVVLLAKEAPCLSDAHSISSSTEPKSAPS